MSESTRGSTGTAVAAGPAAGPMVEVTDLHRSYGTGAAAVHALRGVSFSVPRGELVTLKGRSGSGKTTLLNLVGGLDTADRGRIVVDGTEPAGLGEDGPLALRRDRIGFVFQPFGLIPVPTAAENVGVPMRLRRTDPKVREERVEPLPALADHAAQRPGELSGGQRQRVAITRALANKPALLIADEPTGQLDAETGLAVMELLRAAVRSEGVTALAATHDAQLLGLADRVLELGDGHLVEHVRVRHVRVRRVRVRRVRVGGAPTGVRVVSIRTSDPRPSPVLPHSRAVASPEPAHRAAAPRWKTMGPWDAASFGSTSARRRVSARRTPCSPRPTAGSSAAPTASSPSSSTTTGRAPK